MHRAGVGSSSLEVLLFIASLALVACSFDAVSVVSAPGDLSVGHRRPTLTYASVAGPDRSLPVEIWYPAEDDGDEPNSVYGVAGVVELTADSVREGAVPLDGDYPVLVYSHGSGGLGALAYPYAELIASHGWIVVAPDHIGNTSADLFAGQTAFVESAVNRPEDLRALLDAVEAGQLDGEVTVNADVQRTAVLGHSFGGYTTFRSPGNPIDLEIFGCDVTPDGPGCSALTPEAEASLTTARPDPRVKALVPQAPAFAAAFSADVLGANQPPMLLMSGALDRTTPDATEAQVFWDHTAGTDDHWLQLPNGAHYSFITVCDDVPANLLALLGANEDGCGPDFTPTSTVVPALASYTLAFAEWHANGDDRFAEVFAADTPSLLDSMDLTPR